MQAASSQIRLLPPVCPQENEHAPGWGCVTCVTCVCHVPGATHSRRSLGEHLGLELGAKTCRVRGQQDVSPETADRAPGVPESTQGLPCSGV